MSGLADGGSGYQRRVVDDELDELMRDLPAISLDGPKGVGKTATAAQRAGSSFALDDPGTLDLVKADPQRLAAATAPTLIDEWQRYLPSWDVVRRAVDASPLPGRFLLTGSASPQAPGTHSGAGRIVSLRMRPMTLAERGVETPTVSLGELLSAPARTGARARVSGSTSLTLADYAEQIVGGGFPGLRADTARGRRAAMRSYAELIVDRDFPEAGRAPRSPAVLRRWLRAYAAATGTVASLETIRDAATSGLADKPAKTTTIPYVDTLQRIWVSDPVPAWTPARNHLNRLTLAPKHHLADPALAVALTELSIEDLLDAKAPSTPMPRDGTFLGALFESLVTLDVRVYAQALETTVGHLRTKGGQHEVDLVVIAPGGKVLAIDVKLSQTVGDSDVRQLRWLVDQLGADLVDAVVVTTGRDAYRRQDGIAVVPAALLGP
ncbi:ATP-binding protein [Angustibacter sp. McL0619]|uniref:ATP-binding protein n=1 Tax=Angustibacter sp. McL0619 TaxID=3415676 RepID=UPI003CEBEE58